MLFVGVKKAHGVMGLGVGGVGGVFGGGLFYVEGPDLVLRFVAVSALV